MGVSLSPGCRNCRNCRITVGTVGRLSDDCRTTVGRLSDNCRTTVGQLSDCRLSDCRTYCRTTVGLLSELSDHSRMVTRSSTVGHCRTLSDTVGLSDCRTVGTVGTVGLLSEFTVGLSDHGSKSSSKCESSTVTVVRRHRAIVISVVKSSSFIPWGFPLVYSTSIAHS